MSDKYILDENGNPQEEKDSMKWACWFATGNRIIARNEINRRRISTVFLGLNHNFGEGKPLLFETMIFDGKHDEYQERYSTKEEALAGHAKAVELVKMEVKK